MYLDRMAEEINETLQEAGQLTIAGLSKTFGFPADFVLANVEARMGSVIYGKLDSLNRDILFTDSFVARQTSRIRGVFSAVTRPTPVMSLIIEYGFQEKLFFSVIQDLITSSRLAGSIQGHHDKAVFVPEIYAKTQMTWIQSFFTQNGYLEYDTLSRLGIAEPKQFCQRRFGSGEDILLLSTCCIGRTVVDHVEVSIDDAMASESWIDIMPLLPSPCTRDDLGSFAQQVITSRRQSSSLHVFCDGRIIVSEQLIQKCLKLFDKLMAEKAQKEVSRTRVKAEDQAQGKAAAALLSETSDKPLSKKEQRKQKVQSGGSTAGQQGRGTGREKKVQKSKDKRRGKDEDDDDVKTTSSKQREHVEFLSVEEIIDVLQPNLSECPDELFQDLAEYLFKPLARSYHEVVHSVFRAESHDGKGAVQKKRHMEYEERINGLYTNTRLFHKGIDLFTGEAHQLLTRHLLRTVCAEIVNVCVASVAESNMLACADPAELTTETRAQVLVQLPAGVKSPVVKLHNSLNSQTIDEFFDRLIVVCEQDVCQFMLKKVDKKRERQVVFSHRQSLMEQLKREEEAAMALHLTTVILFMQQTHCMIHAPGRCVPHIITFLADKLPPEQYKVLSDYQSLVLQQLMVSRQSDGEKQEEDEEGAKPSDNDMAAAVVSNLDALKNLVFASKKSLQESVG
ncbi:E3 UFM1-protein ligase 1-like isoform X2 [Corticium candelabrum]|nr:E3 UFM1-protein ligase 1-like isoform X2 [Corticium candelabrum]